MAVLKLADQVGTGRRERGGGLPSPPAGPAVRGGRAAAGGPAENRGCGGATPSSPGARPVLPAAPRAPVPPGGHGVWRPGRAGRCSPGASSSSRGRGHPPGPAALAPRAPVRPRRLPPAGWDGGGCWPVSKGLCLPSGFLPRFVAVPYG